MTEHYFDHPDVTLHYYKFGKGPKNMLCFHGFGMHGKQFKLLEANLGSNYTFYGFDLFFHKETKLKNQSIEVIKKGLSKQELAGIIADFCAHENIDRFSVIGYSMGSHYATAITEQMPGRIDEYIVAAPSSMNPGRLIRFFSKNRAGNKILEKLTSSEKALINMLNFLKRMCILDHKGHQILSREFGTADLRLNFYACFTYLRYLETNEPHLMQVLEKNNISCIFIFGKKDLMFPPHIGKKFIASLKRAEVIILDDNHELINQNFAAALSRILL
jgi:pimeloyl-ACP methyl ester carboxylesterase